MKVMNKSCNKVSVILIIRLFKLKFVDEIFNLKKLAWRIGLLFYCWLILFKWAVIVRILFFWLLRTIRSSFLVWKLHKWINYLFLRWFLFNNFWLHNGWSTLLNRSDWEIWYFWWRFSINFLDLFFFFRLVQFLFIVNRWFSLTSLVFTFFIWNTRNIFIVLGDSLSRILKKTYFRTAFR